ncbi:MAG: CapA family protein [Desulfomonilia bacterium]|nr:CapA family protein [Deltaproteobacteria bacterium]
MIKIGFVGDIALTHSYDALYGAKGPHYPFERIRELLAGHDILIGNLEAPLCLGGEPYPFKVCLKTHPGYAEGMKEAGITALSLANNHILDYREQAMYETMGCLEMQGIGWFGAGASIEEANRPAIIERGGISLGVLSRSEVTIDSPFYASEQERGIAPLDLKELAHAVASLKGRVHAVAVCLHWGKEDWRYPSPDQVRTAHEIIDMGADLIIGHHPHVLQGIERYRWGHIAYSLGNFLFSDLDWRWVNSEGEVVHAFMKLNRARRESAVFSADISETGVHRVSLTGCRTGTDLRAAPVDNPGRFEAGMRVLSAPITMRGYAAFWSVYDELRIRWAQMRYQMKRARKAYKIGPYLIRKARSGAPARPHAEERAGTWKQEGRPQDDHRARSGTMPARTEPASQNGEPRAGSREQKHRQPGEIHRDLETLGKYRQKNHTLIS